MTRIVLGVLLVALAAFEARAEPTGSALPGLEHYDALITSLLEKWNVSGAGLAVARGDRLLLVRGYGLASKEHKVAVGPTSLFRLGSLSDHHRRRRAAAGPGRAPKARRPGAVDPRRRRPPHRSDHRCARPRHHGATLAPALRRLRSRPVGRRRVHAQRGRGGAAPGRAIATGLPTMLRDTLERTLDFTPGTRFAYSNVGYCILGRVVGRVTGSPYETHVRRHVLAPARATRMKVGHTLQPARAR